MKTFNLLIGRTTKLIMTLAIVLMIAGHPAIFSQETKSVFGTDSETTFIWGIEMKTASIQHQLCTQYGMFAGALFNHVVMVGITGAANVTHPRVNYGYTGLMVQVSLNPDKILHLNSQLTLGSGSTKDYQNEKSNVFDNFGNVTGANFYLAEAGINGEINLGIKTRFVMGVGYRLVHGIDQDNENIARTHVTDGDLSGFTITAGIKFGLY